MAFTDIPFPRRQKNIHEGVREGYFCHEGRIDYNSRYKPHLEVLIPIYAKHKDYSRKYQLEEEEAANEILGSGNFAVLKGGTYYNQGGYYRYKGNR